MRDWRDRTPGRHPRSRPMWWPDEQAWPPPRTYRWPHRPAFFMARAAAFLLTMVLVGGVTCVGTLWLLDRLVGEQTPSALVLGMFAALAIPLVFLLLLGLRRLALPLGELIEAAGRVEAGDYSVRVSRRGPRELRVLGRAFNDMAERLQLTEAQRRNLLADVTHELRTPVAVIQGNLEGVLDGVYPADEQHLAPVLEEVRQLSHLIDDLRTLSESESGGLELRREPTDLAVLAGEVLAAFRPQAQGRGVGLGVEAPEDLPLAEVDPVRMREVLMNLMSNSLRHTPEGGAVRVRIGVAEAGRPAGVGERADRQAAAEGGRADGGQGSVVLEVEDTGSGIDPEDLPHVFERFYKAKGSGGSGLGLTIARNLVEAHGGRIEARSGPGKGTTIQLEIPLRIATP